MRYAVALGIVILIGWGCWWFLSPAGPATPLPEVPRLSLFVPPDQLQFGKIPSNTPVERELQLHNRGTTEVTVERFHSGCGCVQVLPSSVRVPAQEAVRVRVLLEWRSEDSEDERVRTEPIAIDVAAVISGGLPPAVWKLRGTVLHVCSFPAHKELYIPPAETPGQGCAAAEMRVPFKMARTVRQVSARSQPPILDVRIEGHESGNRALMVAPRRDLKPGPFHCRLELLGSRAKGGPEVVGSLAVRGEVLSRFKISPAWASLGMVVLGREVQQAFRIVPPPGESVAGVGVQSDGAVATGSWQSACASDGDTWVLSKTINARGSQTEIVKLQVTTKSGNSELLSVPIRYVGVAGD